MQEILKKLDFAMTTDDGKLSFNFVLVAMMFGCIIALFVIFFQRRVVGEIIRRLIEFNAVDEDSSKTISELNQENNISGINMISTKRGIATEVIALGVEWDEKSNKRIIDNDTKLYITQEGIERAKRQYGEKRTNVLVLIVGILAILIVGIALFFLKTALFA